MGLEGPDLQQFALERQAVERKESVRTRAAWVQLEAEGRESMVNHGLKMKRFELDATSFIGKDVRHAGPLSRSRG